MNYHLKSSSRGRKEHKLVFYALAFFAFIVFSIHTIFPSFLPNVFSTLAYPMYKGEQALVLKADLLSVSKEDLSRENEALRRKIAELESSSLLQNVILAENRELKAMMNRATTTAGKRTLARVLVRPPVTLYDTFIIDAGTSADIKTGDRIFVNGDILLGEITDVSPYSSKVKLYSSPGETLQVQIGEKNIQATATGRGNGSFEISLPREFEVKEGDAVIIPALQPALFGTVTAVFGDPARAFEFVLFKTPVNIHEISWVQVEHSEI